jgi:hypothetical protein
MHGVRQVIESVSGKLHLAFRLATDRLHTVPGFRARLAAKVGLHNFCCWLNLLLGRPPLAFADLLDFYATSKWNTIEHRLFSFISIGLSGETAVLTGSGPRTDARIRQRMKA